MDVDKGGFHVKNTTLVVWFHEPTCDFCEV